MQRIGSVVATMTAYCTVGATMSTSTPALYICDTSFEISTSRMMSCKG